MVTEQQPCCACGKNYSTFDGMCFWCALEYVKHQADFDAIQPTKEDKKQ
jgi:NMD protein affecting ribosome stability and mRNA decay